MIGGLNITVLTDTVVSHGNWKLPEYSVTHAELVKERQMLARNETSLWNAVCTRKIMAGLTGLARQTHFKQDGNVPFIPTVTPSSLHPQEPGIPFMVDMSSWLPASSWLNASPATWPVQPQSLTA